MLSDEEVPLYELPEVPESPEVASEDFFDLASFFLLFLVSLSSSLSSAADAPLLSEALLAGPPEPVMPLLPVASCDGITVGDDDMSAPPAPDDEPDAPLLPELTSEEVLPALLAGPPEPVMPLLPVASCDGITVGEDDVSAPLAPDADDPDAPLLPELTSEEVLPALVAGPPEPVMPLLPVAFCEGMIVGEEDVVPEVASVPVVCASATEDTDATITNDNERSVVFNAICSSLHEIKSIVDAAAWRGVDAGAFSRRGCRNGKIGYKPLILFTFSQCKIV